MPKPRPEGLWVATRNGKTIAVSPTAIGIVERLNRIGGRASGAVAVWRPIAPRRAQERTEKEAS